MIHIHPILMDFLLVLQNSMILIESPSTKHLKETNKGLNAQISLPKNKKKEVNYKHKLTN